MKAIVTKYVGPTNTRGARIVASDGDGNKATVSYQYESSAEAAHKAAAVALAKKMGWSTKLCGGGIRNGYAFVFTDSCGKLDGIRMRKGRRK